MAYRMLGSLTEADDAVQESWLRVSRADTSEVDNLGGWLTTVVARVSLDMLRSRRSRREDVLDADDIAARRTARDEVDADHEAMLAGSLGPALLVVLETLAGRARGARVALIAGDPGLVWAPGGTPRVVFAFVVAGGRIVEIELVADPDRLRDVDLEAFDAE